VVGGRYFGRIVQADVIKILFQTLVFNHRLGDTMYLEWR
jgi:hypothetical protein